MQLLCLMLLVDRGARVHLIQESNPDLNLLVRLDANRIGLSSLVGSNHKSASNQPRYIYRI